MFKNLKIFTLTFLSCLGVGSLSAQTDSPYSRYGVGKLKDHAVGSLKGMGGIGYGVSKNPGVNTLNPASYAQVDSLTFIFDFGVNFNTTSFKDPNGKYNKDGGGLEYVTMLFPISKKLGVSIGMLPFSSTGYNISSQSTVNIEDKDVTYNVLNNGSGGLSQVYLGLGYETPLKGLYLGLNASYLFGKLNYGRKVTSSQISAYFPSEYTTLNITTGKVDFGAQYVIPVGLYKRLTLGAVYSPKINSTGGLTRTTYSGDGSNNNEEYSNVVDAGIPEMFGVGFSFGENEKWLIGADLGYERWKHVRFTDELGDGISSNQRFNNRIKVAIGGEYRVAQYSRRYFEKMKLRAGLTFNNSYVNVIDSQKSAKGYKEYGATFGLGFPLVDRQAIGNRTSYLNLNFEYKKLKPDLSNMLSEDYFGISLSMNINELWFLKRKIK